MNVKKISIFLFAVFLSFTFIHFIQAKAPQIEVTLLNQDPDPANQGEIVEIRFKIENNEAETLEDLEVILLPKYPFSLYGDEATKRIGRLRAAQSGADSVIVDYKLKVDEKAVEGDNEIELQIKSGGIVRSFTDNEFLIDIDEYDAPQLKFYIRDSTLLEANQKGTVTLEIANVDVADIKFLELTLLHSEDYELLSQSDYVYLGDIDSDDTESEDFEIFIKKAGEVNFPIKVEYQDEDENNYENQIDLKLSIYDPNELNKYGLKKKSYKYPIIIVLVLVIGVYYFWKKRKKKK